jgi:hypothetical protein
MPSAKAAQGTPAARQMPWHRRYERSDGDVQEQRQVAASATLRRSPPFNLKKAVLLNTCVGRGAVIGLPRLRADIQLSAHSGRSAERGGFSEADSLQQLSL